MKANATFITEQTAFYNNLQREFLERVCSIWMVKLAITKKKYMDADHCSSGEVYWKYCPQVTEVRLFTAIPKISLG